MITIDQHWLFFCQRGPICEVLGSRTPTSLTGVIAYIWYCDVVSKVSWMNPKYGTQGFLLKFTPGFRQAWAKMLDVEGGFNPLVKVSFQLLLYFSDILCWSSPLLGYRPRLLRLHICSTHIWEGRRQQGVCLSVRILQPMEIHAFTPRKYGSRNTTRWDLRKKNPINPHHPLPLIVI